MLFRTSTSLTDVVADLGGQVGDLTRHDLPGDISVSFLDTSDETGPLPRQWRVIGPNEAALRSAVAELQRLLGETGACCTPARFSQGTCYFEDNRSRTPAVQAAQRWAVHRQDDNGNRFVVETGLSREDAERLAATLESGGHKQLYWVEAE